MRLWFVPKKEQWRNWSLPSKLTLVGAYVGVIALVFAIYSYYYGSGTKEIKRKLIVEKAAQFSDDLDKIRVLLPSNVALSSCLEKNPGKDYREKFEKCMRVIRQNFKDAKFLLQKNHSSLDLLIDRKVATNINEICKEMDFLIYEMQNNQFVFEYWQNNGCPVNISIKAVNELKEDMSTLHSKNPKCLLSLESYPIFVSRMKENKDMVSASIESKININSVKSVVYPGNESTINDFFLNMNNYLFKQLVEKIDQLRLHLAHLIERNG